MNWITIGLLAAGMNLVSFPASPDLQPAHCMPPTVISAGSNTLPGLNGMEIMKDAYVVSDVLTEDVSKLSGSSKVRLVTTEEQYILLEMLDANKKVTQVWNLDIGDFSAYGISATFEWIDANFDSYADELAIWWGTADGTNGMLEGYEMARDGILILDLNSGKDIVNFVFADHYLTYSAGENADTESEDFHAKMADDSDFQICDYSYQIQLIDGAIHLSNPLYENQNSEKCPAPEWKVGKYDFDFMTGKFALAE